MRKNIRKKVIAANASPNPFNIKINRQKHSIIGQRRKGTQGLPGVSRALGHAKRKEAWHNKKIKTEKANKFVDKRSIYGSMPFEEQATLRLMQERKKKLKKSINLNDEEVLTHKGRPLNEVQTRNDRTYDSDDDDEQLPSSFVKQAHFGGFSSEGSKTRKEIIDELIIDSKIRKQERKVENEKTADLTEQLDKEWKGILSLMSGMKGQKPPEVAEKKDIYDVAVQELKYEMRAKATSRLKTPEEIAQEEQEKLLKLEEEKRKRMNDDTDNSKALHNHISADSIDDGLNIQPIPVEEVSREQSSDKSEKPDSDDSDESLSDLDENDNSSMLKRDSVLHGTVMRDYGKLIPESKEEFDMIVNNCTPEELSNKVANILKSCLPCKSEKRLAKVDGFFSVLIEYMNEVCMTSLEMCTVLFAPLYDLAQASPLKTGEIFLSFLDREQQLYHESVSSKKKKYLPRLQTVLLLKLCTTLYSVTDFRHPVVTPAFIFMCDILSSEYSFTIQHVIPRLFISRLILNCVAESKRLVPEAICFLNKILVLAINRTVESKFSKKSKGLDLCLSEEDSIINLAKLNLLQKNSKSDSAFKASIILEIIKQLKSFAGLYTNLPAFPEIFFQTSNICQELPVKNYPDALVDEISALQQILSNTKPRYHLVYPNKKPKPLKVFEPAFDSKFTMKKDDLKKKRKMVKQVEQKIRKEEKGMLREERRNTQMIAAEKLNETLQADEERKRKVKELYSELAMQEGEYKKYAKKN